MPEAPRSHGRGTRAGTRKPSRHYWRGTRTGTRKPFAFTVGHRGGVPGSLLRPHGRGTGKPPRSHVRDAVSPPLSLAGHREAPRLHVRGTKKSPAFNGKAQENHLPSRAGHGGRGTGSLPPFRAQRGKPPALTDGVREAPRPHGRGIVKPFCGTGRALGWRRKNSAALRPRHQGVTLEALRCTRRAGAALEKPRGLAAAVPGRGSRPPPRHQASGVAELEISRALPAGGAFS